MTQSLISGTTTPVEAQTAAEYLGIEELDIDHLVIEDDTPVDNFLSAKLQRLLVEVLYSSWASLGMDRPFLADADIGIFAAINQPPIVPDVFVALDVEVPQDFRKKKHRTYLVWELGKSPDVVIELVLNKQGNELGRKLHAYARLGVAYYVVYDPLQQLGDQVLYGFGLHEGRYQPLADLWLEQVGLGLTLWNGIFEGMEETWLRWCDRAGNILPTGAERAAQAEIQVAQASAQAAQAEAKAARLAAKLRELGIDPTDFGPIEIDAPEVEG
jgi:Uma2 family endonuclease